MKFSFSHIYLLEVFDMLKRMSLRKIYIASLTLVVLLLLYFIPTNQEEEEINPTQQLEYEYNNNKAVIYLLDSEDYVARTTISTCACEDVIEKAKDLINGMIIGGTKSAIIPNGFRSIIPSGTEIKEITYENNIITIDFSKELLEISEEYEEKMIEAITYTLINIDGVEKVIIKVEGEELKLLPHSQKQLPTYLDQNYGINKVYELTSIQEIDYYTIYYVNNYNDKNYYVPVTKYINNENQDKVKVIIEELTSAPIYESNLMSFLNVNTKLLDYEMNDKTITLNFNDMILNDITDNNILEEVVYTISLSLDNLYNLDEVIFMVNDEEICKSVIKTLDK